MSEALDSPSVFQTKLIIGWSGLTISAYFIVFILKRIDLNKTLARKPRFDKSIGNDTAFAVTISPSNSGDGNDYAGVSNTNNNSTFISTGTIGDSAKDHDTSSVSTSTTTTTLDSPGHSSEFEAQVHNIATNPHYILENDNNKDNDNDAPRFIRTKLRLEEKLVLYGMVILLIFLTYLLLVFLPSGIVPSLLGTFAITTVLFKTQVADEIRRKRYDRLSGILTLVIFAASFLSLITYGTIGIKEGTIYEGPARIVGYDTEVYQTSSGKGTEKQGTRMDLEVAWGGDWGCPDYNGVQCTAFVSGALCEVDQSEDENRRRHNRRRLEGASDTANSGNDADTSTTTTDTETVADLEKEIEDLKEENEELKEQNSELGQDVITETEEIEEVEDIALDYYVEAVTEEEDAEYYKEEVVEEAEELVEESGELMVEEVVAEYYAADAYEEAEIIEEVLGEEGEEIVEEIQDENLDYYEEVLDVVEEVIDEELDVVDEVNDYVDGVEEVVYDGEDAVEEEIAEKDEEGYENYEEGEGEVVEVEVSADDDEITVDDDDVIEAEEEIAEGYDELEEEAEEEAKEAGEISTYYNNYYSYGNYAFDDDNFEDDWWSYSWSDVWGEYACNDLFDSDIEGETYDIDTEPGQDEWPFVNIYGSCNRCEAYLVDYYSTEHFNMIKSYQTHAMNYAIVGLFGVVVTLSLSLRQWLSPAEEFQRGLLMNEGGNMV
jgi:hypothetical protein